MNGFGLIAPELILLFGGLIVFLLTVFEDKDEKGSGNGYVAITVLWLLAALVATFFQIDMAEKYFVANGASQVAFTMMDVDAFAIFFKVTILIGMVLVAVAGGTLHEQPHGSQGRILEHVPLCHPGHEYRGQRQQFGPALHRH